MGGSSVQRLSLYRKRTERGHVAGLFLCGTGFVLLSLVLGSKRQKLAGFMFVVVDFVEHSQAGLLSSLLKIVHFRFSNIDVTYSA